MKKIEIPPLLRKELEKYLSRLETYTEGPFDRRVSSLIDCAIYLLEEG